MASSASAATTTASATAGAQLVIPVSTTVIPGASNLTFQPSAQVSISASSEQTSFAVESGHDAVQGKEAGQNYGMAADSSNVFWVNSVTEAYGTVAATNSTAFPSPWNRS
jgi:hypothetical protein